MAPATGVQVVYKRQLLEALNNDGPEAHAELVGKLSEDWARESEPWEAARHFYVDDVIDPRETRATICRGLEMAAGKRVERPWKRHGVVPV